MAMALSPSGACKASSGLQSAVACELLCGTLFDDR
jgi:hypothetical protein